MHSVLLDIFLGCFCIISILMLVFAFREKNKLIREREQGIVDEHILLANFEKTIKRIKAMQDKGISFSDEVQKIYLEQINNFIGMTNKYIDIKTNQGNIQLEEHLFEKLMEQKLYKKLIASHKTNWSSGRLYKEKYHLKLLMKELKLKI